MKTLLLALIVVFSVPGLAATRDDSALGFIAFGDWGMGNQQQKDVAKALRKFCGKDLCQFGLLLGDNFYPSGVKNVDDPYWHDRFEKLYGPVEIPFFASLGNHDYGGNVQAQVDYSDKSDWWRMPAKTYYFRRGIAEFYAIDTTVFTEEQARWLRAKAGASDARWKFVYGHHPIRSYGSHGETAQLVKLLLPVLKETKVDFFVCGHEHDKQVIEADGIHYVIAGTAADRRPVRKGRDSVFASSEPGFAHFKVEPNGVTVQLLKGDGTEIEFEHDYAKK